MFLERILEVIAGRDQPSTGTATVGLTRSSWKSRRAYWDSEGSAVDWLTWSNWWRSA
jgi:hypothetical protein